MNGAPMCAEGVRCGPPVHPRYGLVWMYGPPVQSSRWLVTSGCCVLRGLDGSGVDGWKVDVGFAGDVPVDVVHGVASAAPGGVVAGVRGFLLVGSGGGFGEEVFVVEDDLFGGDEAVARGIARQRTHRLVQPPRGGFEQANSREQVPPNLCAAGD